MSTSIVIIGGDARARDTQAQLMGLMYQHALKFNVVDWLTPRLLMELERSARSGPGPGASPSIIVTMPMPRFNELEAIAAALDPEGLRDFMLVRLRTVS